MKQRNNLIPPLPVIEVETVWRFTSRLAAYIHELMLSGKGNYNFCSVKVDNANTSKVLTINVRSSLRLIIGTDGSPAHFYIRTEVLCIP